MKLRHPPIFNGPPKPSDRPWFTVKNDASKDAAEILIYDQIGKDWWSDEGVSAKEFANGLKAIPIDREINVHINSPGGNVWDGLAIFNQLKARQSKVVVIIDGLAASIASVIALAGRELRIPQNALIMIHDPTSIVAGDAEEMRKMADMLDKHRDVLAMAYETKTGKSLDDIKAKMTAETWFTGQEAKDYGLADTVIEEVAMAASVSKFDLSSFRRAPKVIGNTHQPADTGGAKTKDNTMRKRIIALLNKHGIKFEDSATDEQLLALLEAHNPTAAAAAATPAPAAATVPQPAAAAAQAGAVVDLAAFNTLQSNFKTINDRFEAERKTRITAAVTKAVEESRIPANQAERWTARALADESVLNDLAALPQNLIGTDPVSAGIDLTSEDPRMIEKGILNLWGKGIHGAAATRERAMARAAIITKNMARLMPVMNTNTVNTDLKRTVILQQSIRNFAIKVLPLTAFCTVLNGLRLEGTDKVAVPYFPLDQTASTDFNAANGYDTFGNTNSDAKVITVDKRKYQGLKWTSSELARQPFMDVMKGAVLKSEQLGLDTMNDIFSLVTLATYGATVKGEPAAAFDSDDVADLKGTADGLNWPQSGRSLILNSAYDVSLLKDKSVKNALNWGDNQPIREGRIFRIGGFDYYADARVPSPGGEFLQGFIAFMSALLVGFSPIEPTSEVRAQLTRYETVTDPETGATFEYRLWGNPDKDETREIIEVNYGRIAGEPTALRRITSQ